MWKARPNQIAGNDALHAYSILQTMDLDEARQRVSTVFSPHELRIAHSDQKLEAYMCHAPIGGVSVNRLRYGATVDIDIGRTTDFVLLMMPIAGVSDIRCGDQCIRSTPALASVVSPTLPLRMTSHADCDQIMIRIDRALIERCCAQQLGRDLRQPIEFQLGMDLCADSSESLRAFVGYVISELDRETNVLASPLARAQAEHLLVATLLLTQPHSYRDELLRPVRPIAPAFVKRIEQFIEVHADQPLTAGDLASHAGVSMSTLFSGFREYRNTSPMAHLKHVRMQRAHDELQAADPATSTVTNIATRWGFVHLGRFASDYRRKFGEPPSETLRH